MLLCHFLWPLLHAAGWASQREPSECDECVTSVWRTDAARQTMCWALQTCVTTSISYKLHHSPLCGRDIYPPVGSKPNVACSGLLMRCQLKPTYGGSHSSTISIMQCFSCCRCCRCCRLCWCCWCQLSLCVSDMCWCVLCSRCCCCSSFDCCCCCCRPVQVPCLRLMTPLPTSAASSPWTHRKVSGSC